MSFLEKLVTESSLTPRQLESLSSYLRVSTGELRLRDAAAIVSKGRKKGEPNRPLTVGSYYRTVSQARANVRQALVTVLIALWLGVARIEEVRRLFELVGGSARELTEDEAERTIQLLEALLQRIIV